MLHAVSVMTKYYLSRMPPSSLSGFFNELSPSQGQFLPGPETQCIKLALLLVRHISTLNSDP